MMYDMSTKPKNIYNFFLSLDDKTRNIIFVTFAQSNPARLKFKPSRLDSSALHARFGKKLGTPGVTWYSLCRDFHSHRRRLPLFPATLTIVRCLVGHNKLILTPGRKSWSWRGYRNVHRPAGIWPKIFECWRCCTVASDGVAWQRWVTA